jgi:hypothetical protein
MAASAYQPPSTRRVCISPLIACSSIREMSHMSLPSSPEENAIGTELRVSSSQVEMQVHVPCNIGLITNHSNLPDRVSVPNSDNQFLSAAQSIWLPCHAPIPIKRSEQPRSHHRCMDTSTNAKSMVIYSTSPDRCQERQNLSPFRFR